MNSKGDNFDVVPETSKKNRNKEASSDEMIKHDRNAHKRSKSEISRLRDEGTSNFVKLSDIVYPDSLTYSSEATSEIALDNSCTGNKTEQSKNEVSHPYNQGMQVLGNLSNERISYIGQNTPSNINTSRNDCAAGKIKDSGASKGKITFSIDHILAVPGSSQYREDIPRHTGQNISSNMNICKNENILGKLSDSGASKGKITFSMDHILAVPGSSQSCENITQSNLNLKNLQNRFPSKLQTAVETEKKTSMCLSCNKEIFNHANVHEGKNSNNYCWCKYSSNISFVSYSKEASNESNHTCNVCHVNFQCKAELEDHYLGHEEHHVETCRICLEKVNKHIHKRKGRQFYQCCKCAYGNYHRNKLRQHLYIHSDLQLFKCDRCGMRFTQKRSHDRHFNNLWHM